MSRFLDQDFEKLILYIKGYSLTDALSSKVRISQIKRAHKYCLSALQAWSVMEQKGKADKLQISNINIDAKELPFDLLSECFSDIVSSFFAALHGLYKPANMSLRSSIETFTKGISSLHSTEASTTKSVYRIFEIAKTCDTFSNASEKYFNTVHQQYALLCNFTHTSTKAHMVGNHALTNFTKQDNEQLKVWVSHYEATIKAMLSILILSNSRIYLDTPPKAQDIYEETVPKEVRLNALGMNSR